MKKLITILFVAVSVFILAFSTSACTEIIVIPNSGGNTSNSSTNVISVPASDNSVSTTSADSAVPSDSAQQEAVLNTFVMEAEYVDFTGIVGGGNSVEAVGCDMIYGNGSDDEIAKGWSNGYFVGYTHKEGVKLTFEFTSDRAVTNATIVLRLGSEMGDLTFDPDCFEVKLNDTVIDYNGVYLKAYPVLPEMKFEDKTITTKANLKEGANVLTLEVLENNLAAGTTGPIIDCVKITAKANMSWAPKTDNPAARDSGI